MQPRNSWRLWPPAVSRCVLRSVASIPESLAALAAVAPRFQQIFADAGLTPESFLEIRMSVAANDDVRHPTHADVAGVRDHLSREKVFGRPGRAAVPESRACVSERTTMRIDSSFKPDEGCIAFTVPPSMAHRLDEYREGSRNDTQICRGESPYKAAAACRDQVATPYIKPFDSDADEESASRWSDAVHAPRTAACDSARSIS